MPSQPVWLSHLGSILSELRTLDGDYLDRQAIERLFGIRERRARQLMAGLPSVKVGNAIAVSREALINRLEGYADSNHSAAQVDRGSANEYTSGSSQRLKSRNSLPTGVILLPGELRLRFTTATDLAAKVSAVLLVIRTDWDGLAGQMRTAPDDPAPDQQTVPAAQRRNRNAVEPVSDPVLPPAGRSNAARHSGGKETLATQALDRSTREHDAEERYEEFCRATVKGHLAALPQAIRSRRLAETRSNIRRAQPQLRRSELDEIAQRELESTIRAELHLPTIDEFTARSR